MRSFTKSTCCQAFSICLQATRTIIMSDEGTLRSHCAQEESESDSRCSNNTTLSSVGGGTLSDSDRFIHQLHLDACENQEETYIDPKTGYKVFTEFAHRTRGKCCGSACRHCPYGQMNVQDPAKKKTFNMLFYV